MLVTAALTTAAVANELRKPEAERTWHGRLGPVPYDFRRPSLARVRAAFWAPDGPLFTPRPAGIGWTLNVGRIVRAFRERAAA